LRIGVEGLEFRVRVRVEGLWSRVRKTGFRGSV